MFIPDPGSKSHQIPDPDPQQKKSSILNSNFFTKISEIFFRMFIPDPDPQHWFHGLCDMLLIVLIVLESTLPT
jgi:hypothetical protein